MSSRATVPMCGLLLVVAGHGWAEPVDLDAGRSAWRLERPVTRRGSQGSLAPRFVALVLPMGVAAHAQRDLCDLRLVAVDGTEAPYVLDRQVERKARTAFGGRLIDLRQERKRSSQWVVGSGSTGSTTRPSAWRRRCGGGSCASPPTTRAPPRSAWPDDRRP